MGSVLAAFFHAHQSQEAWWCKTKTTPQKVNHPTNNVLLPSDEAPGDHCLSKLLGIKMEELWQVFFECKLAKKKGKHNIIDEEQMKKFMRDNELTHVLVDGESNKQPAMRVGMAKNDPSAAEQWRSKKKPPLPLRDVAEKFRADAKECFELKDEATKQKERLVTASSSTPSMPSTPSVPSMPSMPTTPTMPSNASNASPSATPHASPSATDSSSSSPRLSKPPTLPDTMDDPSACDETCELERKKKEDDDKRKKAVSAAVGVKKITEVTDPNQLPTLVAKNVCITSDKDIKAVTRELAKLSKQVKSVDLLEVVHCNDTTSSLVEVPCSAKQSGFKERARRSRWMERGLESVRRFKEEDALVDENDDDDDNNETACTNDDAARWLIAHLGDSHPKEFVKSAQALDMPTHQGKMDAECTAAMWSDAGVGVAAQRVIMKCFISHFGCKFTVPEASINKLAAHSVPPIVGAIDHMDAILNFWHKDLVELVTAQIAGEHKNQPEGFSCSSVDLVIGADHGQGSFRAGVKVIHRDLDQSVKATAVHGLG
jgi:hypothetical protein